MSFMNLQQAQPEDVQEEIIHTLSNLQRIFPRWLICTCRFMHKGFFYISDNYEEVLGFNDEAITSATEPEAYFKRIHPNDVEHFYRCAASITEMLTEGDKEEVHKYRFVFNYRLQHGSGRYMHVHDEKAILKLKNGQNLYYLLLRDISTETPYSGVKLSVYKEGQGEKKILEYNSSQQTSKLTTREGEMIPLMRQGLSVKEIAWHLGISPHTVRNIRQKLFEKFEVNNVIELLNKMDSLAEAQQATVRTANQWRFASAV